MNSLLRLVRRLLRTDREIAPVRILGELEITVDGTPLRVGQRGLR